jgi:hypothetical protein
MFAGKYPGLHQHGRKRGLMAADDLAPAVAGYRTFTDNTMYRSLPQRESVWARAGRQKIRDFEGVTGFS